MDEKDPWLVTLTPEQYARIRLAATAQGMTVKEWALATLQNYAEEQIEIEAFNRRRGFQVVQSVVPLEILETYPEEKKHPELDSP